MLVNFALVKYKFKISNIYQKKKNKNKKKSEKVNEQVYYKKVPTNFAIFTVKHMC